MPSDSPQLALARQLVRIGLSPSYASELANGQRSPSLKLAAKIERELSIPVASWLTAGGAVDAFVKARPGDPAVLAAARAS
jgi:transcriptional regulator with XRE-family HTH domain